MANPRDNHARIIVKNYPADTTNRDLQIMFEKYGKIEDLFSPKHRQSDKPRGFTFIRYRRVEDANDAIRGMNGRDIDGQKIKVEFSHDSGPPPRGGDSAPRGRGRSSRGPPPPVRGSRDEPRSRRRSPSPRRYRSRSSSPRNNWRGRERYSDRDDYHHGGPPPVGPPPVPPLSGGGPSQQPYIRAQDSTMMNGPPPQLPPSHYPPPMDHSFPPRAGLGPPPPTGPPMGGPPTSQIPPGRKTLLNTPGGPGPNIPPQQQQPGIGGPGGPPPSSSHDRYRDAPPRGQPPPGGMPPPGGPRDYRSQPPDQFNTGPPLPPPQQQGDRRDPYSSRDSYQQGHGGPPPQSRDRNDGNYMPPPPSRGPPPRDGYNPPPSSGPRPYSEDQYNSQHSSNNQYDFPPMRSDNAPSSYPPPSRGAGRAHDDYGYYKGDDGYPPTDDYRSSGTRYQDSNSGSGYRTTSPPPSGPSRQSYEYSTSGGDRSGYSSTCYKDDYQYDTAPKYTSGDPLPSSGGGSRLPPQDYHRPYSGSTQGPGGKDSSNWGYSPRSGSSDHLGGGGGSLPPSQPTRKVVYDNSESDGRYTITQQQSPHRNRDYSAGTGSSGGGGQQSNSSNSPSSFGNKSGPSGGGGYSQQGSNDGSRSVSGYSSYSMSSYSTGYGGSSGGQGLTAGFTSEGSSSQRPSTGGGSTSSGKGASISGSSSRGPPPTNTGFVPSHNYTKPGPPF